MHFRAEFALRRFTPRVRIVRQRRAQGNDGIDRLDFGFGREEWRGTGCYRVLCFSDRGGTPRCGIDFTGGMLLQHILVFDPDLGMLLLAGETVHVGFGCGPKPLFAFAVSLEAKAVVALEAEGAVAFATASAAGCSIDFGGRYESGVPGGVRSRVHVRLGLGGVGGWLE